MRNKKIGSKIPGFDKNTVKINRIEISDAENYIG